MSPPGKLLLSAGLALAAAPIIGIDRALFSPPSACAEDVTRSPADEEVRRLRSYSTELLKELQALRADLAVSEQARRKTESLLVEAARRSQQQCEQPQAIHPREVVHHESQAPPDEDRSLRSYNAELLKELERLRADLAASEQARRRTDSLLAETTRSSRQQREEKQATYAHETVRHEREVAAAHSQLESVKTEEARQADRATQLATELQDTRTASAATRAELDAVRRENATLSLQATELRAAKEEVRKLQASFREKEIRIQELSHGKQPRPRELQGLRSDQKSIESALRQARSKQAARAGNLSKTLLAAPRPPVLAPAGDLAKEELAQGDSPELREQLSIERERRETLEREIQRLTSAGDPEERFLEVWKAMQTARAEVLVLSNQLAEERRNREDLEVALTHLNPETGKTSAGAKDVAQRLTATLRERRAEADRLAEQLKAANEVITGLKARLEADGSASAENKVLANLDQDNQLLRKALTAAEDANRNLRAKAELAERLAEMVYGKGR